MEFCPENNVARLQPEVRSYLQLMQGRQASVQENKERSSLEKEKTALLFTRHVRNTVEAMSGGSENLLEQYGFLGLHEQTLNSPYAIPAAEMTPDQKLLFANMNAP
jgi:hypothetical protein